jgi:hypothetical protein
MRKILFLLLISYVSLVAKAQHAHEGTNPNITPYHEAQDAMNGLNGLRFNNGAAWQLFVAKHPNWGAKFNYYSGMPIVATGPAFTYTPGSNAVSKALDFLSNELFGLNIPTEQLVLTSNYSDEKFTYVHFKQVYQGREVAFSKVTVRFTKDLRIQSFNVRAFSNLPANFNTNINGVQAIQSAESNLITTVLQSKLANEMYIMPIPSNGKYEYALVYKVQTLTQDTKEMQGDYSSYVDAQSGKVLYRNNKVATVNGNMQGHIRSASALSPLTATPLANMRVVQGGINYYTDANGNFNTPTTTAANLTFYLEGLYCKVTDGANGTVSPSFTTLVNNGANLFFDSLAANTQSTKVNMYDAVNKVHDYMKSKFPTFTAMDAPLPTRVDRTDGNCNAFYNGSSINFYATDATCYGTAYIRDICYHEYGHGINDQYYSDKGANWNNGGMGEGYADVWAFNITQNPILGPAFFINNPNSVIRRYDINPKVYPQDITGEVHDDGEIIAGAWWDTYLLWGNQLAASNLFAETYDALSTAPNGEEGSLYYQILIDALTYDDVDNNIINGTPNIQPIIKGFAKHGIYILGDAEVMHTPTNTATVNTATNVSATVNSSFPPLVNDVRMIIRLKQQIQLAFDTVKMSSTGAMNFAGIVPGKAKGLYEYILGATDIFSLKDFNAYAPLQSSFAITQTQRNISYYLPVGYAPKLTQDFENGFVGWTVGQLSDNATVGKWIVATPVGSTTNGALVQTDKDHTTGSGKCLVTGNATSATATVGSADVDNGRTTVLSPVFNLSSYTDPFLSYWRWFTNSQGNTNPRKDVWRVFLTDNGGVNLTPIDRTYQPDASWRRQCVKLKDAKAGINLNNVQFVFIAVDSAVTGVTGGSLVEAAIDDFTIMDAGEAVPQGIVDWQYGLVKMYPNPASDLVAIEMPQAIEATIVVQDITGKIIYKDEFNTQKYLLNTSNWANANYVVKIIAANGGQINTKLQVVR